MFGVQVHFSPHAVKRERNFPVSKHRSKRVHKKLVKRFGSEFRDDPALFKTPMGIVAHPALRAAIMAEFKEWPGGYDAFI